MEEEEEEELESHEIVIKPGQRGMERGEKAGELGSDIVYTLLLIFSILF